MRRHLAGPPNIWKRSTGFWRKRFDKHLANGMSPDSPQRPHVTKGAPNLVLILLDDVGFGAISTFGGREAPRSLS